MRPPIVDVYMRIHRLGDEYAFRVSNHLKDSQLWYIAEVYEWVYPSENVDADKFKTYKEAVQWGNKTVDKLRKNK